MDAAIDYLRTPLSGQASDLHPSKSVSCMDTNPNDVTRLYAIWLDLLQSFVCDDRIAILPRSCSGKYVQPTRRDYAYAERCITGID